MPITRWPDVAVVAEFAVWPNCNHRNSLSLDRDVLQLHSWPLSQQCCDTVHQHLGLWYIFLSKPHSPLSSPADLLCLNQDSSFWKLLIPHSVFTLLTRAIIIFFCLTEGESIARGVEVAQQGTALELPRSFITSPVTVQTCLAYIRLLNVFDFLTSTCSSDNPGVCLLHTRPGVTGRGCRLTWGVNVAGISLSLCLWKMLQNQGKGLS